MKGADGAKRVKRDLRRLAVLWLLATLLLVGAVAVVAVWLAPLITSLQAISPGATTQQFCVVAALNAAAGCVTVSLVHSTPGLTLCIPVNDVTAYKVASEYACYSSGGKVTFGGTPTIDGASSALNLTLTLIGAVVVLAALLSALFLVLFLLARGPVAHGRGDLLGPDVFAVDGGESGAANSDVASEIAALSRALAALSDRAASDTEARLHLELAFGAVRKETTDALAETRSDVRRLSDAVRDLRGGGEAPAPRGGWERDTRDYDLDPGKPGDAYDLVYAGRGRGGGRGGRGRGGRRGSRWDSDDTIYREGGGVPGATRGVPRPPERWRKGSEDAAPADDEDNY